MSTCIDADNLWLRPGSGPFFSIADTSTAPAGNASFALGLSYQSRPIGLLVPGPNRDGTTIHVVDNMLNATFLWSLGLTERLELTFAAPITLYQDGAGLGGVLNTDEPLQRSAIRDPRLGLAFAILPQPRVGPSQGFSLTARLDLGLPAGDETLFAGSSMATAVPSLVSAIRVGRFGLAAEAGARIRESTSIAGSVIGSQLTGAVGASYDVLAQRRLTVGAEVFALYTLATQPSSPLIPAEWILSASTAPFLAGDVSFSLGGGGTIPFADEHAVTSPRFRFTFAARYAPGGRDTDGDGVLDRDDACPDVPEDRDGFQDSDGCPDPDNDGDGIPDALDRCRDAPEDRDGFQDEDGCPDLDDDGDGIPDDTDQCRNQPEDRDGFQDEDGCPDPDNDGDGIPDEHDLCPNGAEDFDGFKDEDGCPDPDNDLDQIPDERDLCPDAKEDLDGFQDDDGCPDLDNDEDGVPDLEDACPLHPETINGQQDEDGCPEPGATATVRWEKDQVIVDGLVPFTPGGARMPPALEAQLRMAAQLMRGRMPLTSVIIEAYPDRPGDGSARGLELAATRADAVKARLVAGGIPAELITPAAGDPTLRRPPRAPQIEITVSRPPRPKAPPAALTPEKRAPSPAPQSPSPPSKPSPPAEESHR
nr:thrombospondin type 3 repeat-containing protein [Chondromyces crocatus]